MRLVLALVVGALFGFGTSLWYQGEPPFAGSSYSGKSDMTITISDSYLARQAGPPIEAAGDGRVSHVTVSTASGDVAFVRAQGSVNGVSVPIGASVSPRVSGGEIVLDVKSVHVGPFPIPQVITGPLTSVVNNRVQELVNNSPYYVVGAGTSTAGLQIYLRQR